MVGRLSQLGARRAIERDDGAVDMEEGGLAADKSTAAALGGWIVFEDECGQSLRSSQSSTWGRRGITRSSGSARGTRARLGRRAGPRQQGYAGNRGTTPHLPGRKLLLSKAARPVPTEVDRFPAKRGRHRRPQPAHADPRPLSGHVAAAQRRLRQQRGRAHHLPGIHHGLQLRPRRRSSLLPAAYNPAPRPTRNCESQGLLWSGPRVLVHVPTTGKSSPTADETIRTRHDRARGTTAEMLGDQVPGGG